MFLQGLHYTHIINIHKERSGNGWNELIIAIRSNRVTQVVSWHQVLMWFFGWKKINYMFYFVTFHPEEELVALTVFHNSVRTKFQFVIKKICNRSSLGNKISYLLGFSSEPWWIIRCNLNYSRTHIYMKHQ